MTGALLTATAVLGCLAAILGGPVGLALVMVALACLVVGIERRGEGR